MCAARQRNRERDAGRRRVISGDPNAEEPIMPITLPPHRTRRTVLYLAGGAAGFAALAARPLVGLAQTEPAGQPAKIATIGAGREGSALGALFVKAGHPVMFSSRHPEQLKDLVVGLGPLAKAATVAEAIAFGEVVLLIVPYPAVPEIGKEYGSALATKRLVIDVSNPSGGRDGEAIVKWVDEQGGAGLATAKALPGAHIVRAFNAIGSTQLASLAHRAGEPAGVPIAGDDQSALALASRLIKEIGFEPVVVGGLAMGKYLVPRTPLGGVHTPEEIRQIAATLK
jgi:8-hydroxy-5-deazaflavin:NADPH oxidoreductase